MSDKHPSIEFTLWEVFEDDAVGCFDLVQLLGLDPDVQSVSEEDELPPMSRAAYAAIGAFLRLVAGSERLYDAVGGLIEEGWEVDVLSGATDDLSFRSLPGTDPAEAWARALELLRPVCLWSTVRTTAEQLLAGSFLEGVTDLHARPDGVSAREGQLPTIPPDRLLHTIRSRYLSGGRGEPLLRVLPLLRDRISVTLDMAFELTAEGAVEVQCPSDPEAAELDGPEDETARKKAVNNHRIILSRSRQRIEDALIDGHPRLQALVTGARRAPLPERVEAVLGPRAGELSGRHLRRARAIARLIWLAGWPDGADRLDEFLAESLGSEAPKAALAAAETGLWRAVIETGLRPPAPWEALGHGGDARATTLFLLRYVTWVQGEDRPGLETLGAELTSAEPGREAGNRAAAIIGKVRRRLVEHLDSEASAPGPPPSAPAPPSARPRPPAPAPPPAGMFRGLGSWPTAWRVPGVTASTGQLREEAREALRLRRQRSRPLSRASRQMARRLRGLKEGLDHLVAAARWWLPASAPRLALAPGGVLGDEEVRVGSRLELLAPVPDVDEGALRPFVLVERDGDSEVLLPLASDAWPDLSEFPLREGRRAIAVVPEGPVGPRRFLLALVPEEHDIDWAAPPELRWEPLREAIEEGLVQASSASVEVLA